MKGEFTAIIESAPEGGYWAVCPEIPGANGQGETIEQAKESFRISEERYKEQMATSTDVLDARTLLSKTMTNYYNALYDFKISKAALYRAMGREVME